MQNNNSGFAPSDSLSVLTHARNRVTKTWNADGTISPFDDAKYYTLKPYTVANIGELSSLLNDLAADPQSCLLRGTPVPLGTQASRDGIQFQPGKVRKALDYFDDQPLHAVMIDVDGYHNFAYDPVTHTAGAIDEFISLEMPIEWHGAAYHWHLSSSFGHPSKADTGLRVHLWFWLARPLTSAQLKAFAQATALPARTPCLLT